MEAHAQSGWLCELMVGPDDALVRECEFVELLVDTGATVRYEDRRLPVSR